DEAEKTYGSLDTISLESTSNSPVEFYDMSTELMIVGTNNSNKLLVETEPAVSNKVVDISRQRNRISVKISCSWHINLSQPKSSPVVIITSIIGEHNHQLQPDIALYALKYRKLSSEILEQIKFYVTNGNMESKQIFPLLTAQFTSHTIHKNDLYNAVQRFRKPLNQCHGEAQQFVKYLSKLGGHFDEFYKEFLHTRNSTFEEDFHRRWLRLLDKYPQIHDYINRALQGCINYLNSLPTYQALSIVESIFPKVLEVLKLYLTPHILAIQQQQITGCLLYYAQPRMKDDIQKLQASLQLDYENGFLEDQLDRTQKALNTALDLEYEKELLNIITRFINQKVSIYENFNKEDACSDQSKPIVIMDPLVVKHRGQPSTKRLKSSSEINSHQALEHNQSAINPQDPNLRIPFSKVVSNSNQIVDVPNNTED
ncbi:19649_t:CDS:2, partial [Gigaspora rosea]